MSSRGTRCQNASSDHPPVPVPPRQGEKKRRLGRLTHALLAAADSTLPKIEVSGSQEECRDREADIADAAVLQEPALPVRVLPHA
jgi:hypothetical protein